MDPTQNKDSFDSFGPGGNSSGAPVGGFGQANPAVGGFGQANPAVGGFGQANPAVGGAGVVPNNPMVATGLSGVGMGTSAGGSGADDIVLGGGSSVRKPKKGIIIGVIVAVLVVIVGLVTLSTTGRLGNGATGKYEDFYELMIYGDLDDKEADSENDASEFYYAVAVGQLEPSSQERKDYYEKVTKSLDQLINKTKSKSEVNSALQDIRNNVINTNAMSVVLFESEVTKGLSSGDSLTLEDYLKNNNLEFITIETNTDEGIEGNEETYHVMQMYYDSVKELMEYSKSLGCGDENDGTRYSCNMDQIEQLSEEKANRFFDLQSRSRSSRRYLSSIYEKMMRNLIDNIQAVSDYYGETNNDKA